MYFLNKIKKGRDLKKKDEKKVLEPNLHYMQIELQKHTYVCDY